MFNKASEFTIADNSSSPYAWMIEGLDASDVLAAGSVENFVRGSAKTYINATNNSGAKDVTVYRVWRSGHEFDAAVAEISSILDI